MYDILRQQTILQQLAATTYPNIIGASPAPVETTSLPYISPTTTAFQWLNGTAAATPLPSVQVYSVVDDSCVFFLYYFAQ